MDCMHPMGSNKRVARISILLSVLCVLLLSGCRGGHAPVIEGKDWQGASSIVVNARHPYYRVRSGDPLYAIAWAVGTDFRNLAHLNRLRAPYRIYPGQRLRLVARALKGPARKTRATPRVHTAHRSLPHQPHYPPPRHWLRPVRGPIVRGFAPYKAGGNQGVDFSGRYGASVVSAAAGRVVYSGSGLRGYGKLIIIKHNDSFLSAYAYNSRLWVHQGQRVRAGQKIAAMGRVASGRVLLHFEIRYNGAPVDPRRYIR